MAQPVSSSSRLLVSLSSFFRKPFWSSWRTITVVYALIPIIIGILKWSKNNDTYQIYKSVFVNTLQQLPLYDFYPYLHGDCNHYGPVFFYVIAPFAMLPDTWGMLLWLCFLVATFYVAVRYMPLQRWQKVFMFWFCAHEVLTPLFVEQYDLAMAASYLLMFACIEKKQPVWAAFFIVINIFIKLYGVMGLAFFFFVEDKKKFILACLGWAALFFVLPMLVSSPEYVVQQYFGWYDSLVAKNAQNLAEAFNTTNTSLLGIPRKISGNTEYSDLWLIIPGILLFLSPFRRISQYRNVGFRYAMLASVTMFVTLFSTGTESYGYIAPMTGFVVWYTTAPWRRGRWSLVLLIYAFIFTSLCTSDVFFPRFIWKQWLEPYALKALPTTIVWLVVIWEMNFRDYSNRGSNHGDRLLDGGQRPNQQVSPVIDKQKPVIGFDAKRVVRNATGLGNYCRTLVNDLARVSPADWQLRLYTPDAGRDSLRQQVVTSNRLCFVYPEHRPLKLQRSLWRVGPIVSDLQRDGVSLYHGLTGELPRGIHQSGIRSVVTIHDLIFLRHPEYYHWLDTKIYAWKFRVACREADRIIAISERTRQDIIELGGVSPDKIDLIYQSCSPRFSTEATPQQVAAVRQRYGLPQRFLLSVGSIEERKNIRLAVRALHLLPQDIHLVAVGKSTKYAEQVLQEAQRDQLGQRVHFLHGVSDDDLQALYHEAEVFVYPSRYEGFGIPIIEAIHSGLPVVAATGSCLEEAGGPDCLYVSPDNSEALAAAVSQLLKGAPGREQRIARSRDYVRRFEGTDVAAQVLNVYRTLLNS